MNRFLKYKKYCKTLLDEQGVNLKMDGLACIKKFIAGELNTIHFEVFIFGNPDYSSTVTICEYDGRTQIEQSIHEKDLLIHFPFSNREDAVKYPYFEGKTIYELLEDEKAFADVGGVNVE